MTDTLDSLFAEAKARFLDAHIGEAATRRARPDLPACSTCRRRPS